MTEKVLVALKPGLENDILCRLALSVAQPSTTFLLQSLVLVGTNDDERQRLEAAKADLTRLSAIFDEAGAKVDTRVELVEMMPGSRIVATASEEGVDLIVVGLAQRSRVGKALLGSDAQRVLLSASCPVLTTRFS